jgi:hypothetical protein
VDGHSVLKSARTPGFLRSTKQHGYTDGPPFQRSLWHPLRPSACGSKIPSWPWLQRKRRPQRTSSGPSCRLPGTLILGTFPDAVGEAPPGATEVSGVWRSAPAKLPFPTRVVLAITSSSRPWGRGMRAKADAVMAATGRRAQAACICLHALAGTLPGASAQILPSGKLLPTCWVVSKPIKRVSLWPPGRLWLMRSWRTKTGEMEAGRGCRLTRPTCPVAGVVGISDCVLQTQNTDSLRSAGGCK